MTQYSAISPPPMRGFVIRPFLNEDRKEGIPMFCTKRVPIVGVVVRTRTDRSEDWRSCSEILPVIHSPSYASDPSGGMVIYESGNWDDPAFTVVWCHWPPEEDERRLADLHAFVEQEARSKLERLARFQAAREGEE